MSFFLESERLLLRRLSFDDFQFLFKLETDPEVMKYIGPPRDEPTVRERTQRSLDQYENGTGYGKWMAIEKESGNPIGWFVLTNLDGTELIEVGYRLDKPYWGKGYATEMSRVLLGYGFKQLRLEKIVAVTLHNNRASQNVLTKIGLKYLRDDRFYDKDVMYFELAKDEYEANLASSTT
ncbi:MAG: GNAT family N-acetyltransferase [Planctomycetota bacterium]